VDTEGNIKLCWASKQNMGNIFKPIGSEYNSCFYDYRKLVWIPRKCKTCEYLGSCFVGCKYSKNVNNYSGDVLLE